MAPQGARRHERSSRGRVVLLQPCGVSSGSIQAKELTLWQVTRLVWTPRPQLWLHCTNRQLFTTAYFASGCTASIDSGFSAVPRQSLHCMNTVP
jgi:hypothetical protein